MYSDAESLYSSAESGITAIKKSWDASLGEFNITGMDLAWKNEINQVWKNKEEMIQEKYQLDFEDFLLQIFDPLSDFSGNLAGVVKNSVADGFYKGLNILEDFRPSNYKDVDFWKKGGRALGAIGTVTDVYENTKENLFDREGNFSPSWDGLQDTITDTGVDILAGATSSAAGAAVGSLFLPPLGTAVGAVAGVVAGKVLNADFVDINHDGKKDSAVDIAKIAVDGLCDAVGNFIDSIF